MLEKLYFNKNTLLEINVKVKQCMLLYIEVEINKYSIRINIFIFNLFDNQRILFSNLLYRCKCPLPPQSDHPFWLFVSLNEISSTLCILGKLKTVWWNPKWKQRAENVHVRIWRHRYYRWCGGVSCLPGTPQILCQPQRDQLYLYTLPGGGGVDQWL